MNEEQVEKIASVIEHALQSSQYFTSLYNGRSKDASAALRDAARAAIAAIGDGWRDVASALTTTPLIIEAITPTDDEWEACEVVQDRYDLMKRLIRAALTPPPGEKP